MSAGAVVVLRIVLFVILALCAIVVCVLVAIDSRRSWVPLSEISELGFREAMRRRGGDPLRRRWTLALILLMIGIGLVLHYGPF
jgi:preprotein translocase subunit SecG